jgi:hypothetical protein
MDHFAGLFEALVLVLTAASFACLLGFMVWDAMLDRKRSAIAESARSGLALVNAHPAAANLAAAGDWVSSSKAA